MELCGGTHTRATGEIGLFRIVGESAIAAGVRRIEAVAGLEAYDLANDQLRLLRSVAGQLNSPVAELEKKVESLLAHQKALEKEVQIAMQRNASNAASELLRARRQVNGIPLITHNLGDATGDFLQAIADALKGRFKGVVVLGGGSAGSVTLIATVSAEYTAKVQAGKIIQPLRPSSAAKAAANPTTPAAAAKTRASWTKRWRRRRVCWVKQRSAAVPQRASRTRKVSSASESRGLLRLVFDSRLMLANANLVRALSDFSLQPICPISRCDCRRSRASGAS
jgi:alanyl-tRNA synthetase